MTPSLLASAIDEDPGTGILACAQEALEAVHLDAFHAMQGAAGGHGGATAWHAPVALARRQRSVLSDVTVLLAKCTLGLKVRLPARLLRPPRLPKALGLVNCS